MPPGPARGRAAASARGTPGKRRVPSAARSARGTGSSRAARGHPRDPGPGGRRRSPLSTPSGLLPPNPTGAAHPRPPGEPPWPPSAGGHWGLSSLRFPPCYPRLGAHPHPATVAPASCPPQVLIYSPKEPLWASSAMLVCLKSPAPEEMSSSPTSTSAAADASPGGRGESVRRVQCQPWRGGGRDPLRCPRKRVLLLALGMAVTCCLFSTVFTTRVGTDCSARCLFTQCHPSKVSCDENKAEFYILTAEIGWPQAPTWRWLVLWWAQGITTARDVWPRYAHHDAFVTDPLGCQSATILHKDTVLLSSQGLTACSVSNTPC